MPTGKRCGTGAGPEHGQQQLRAKSRHIYIYLAASSLQRGPSWERSNSTHVPRRALKARASDFRRKPNF
eukprot:2789952-Alexandrium_andersonii.AAC.1